MKLLKPILALFILLILLGTYAWFGIIQVEKQVENDKVFLLPKNLSDQLQSFKLVTSDFEIQVENKEGLWWVTEPVHYLANQEYIEKGLQIMADALARRDFELKEDHYGFRPGKAFILFHFKDGLNKRLKVATESGPGDTIYVLDQDLQRVFVVHNVWGQFLYYPITRFYHPFLPIAAKSVLSVKLLKQGQNYWGVEPRPDQTLKIDYLGQSYSIPKAQALWFYKKLREFPLQNFKFNTELTFKPYWQLVVGTENGNIIFDFDEKAEKIYGQQANVFAEIEPYSLKSLEYEIQKVIKSDKK